MFNHAGTKPLVYIAGPLFSEAEREFNRLVRDALQPRFDTYLPQEDGILLVNAVDINSPAEEVDRAFKNIFAADIAAIQKAQLVLIIMDGRCIDEGAAFEIGYAYAVGKPCYGLQTDPRRLLPLGNNPMIARALKRVFLSVNELQAWQNELAT